MSFSSRDRRHASSAKLRRVLRALFAVLLAPAVAVPAHATVYSFTNIADSTTHGIDWSFLPSINDLGTVAFIATAPVVGDGVFKSDGVTVTTIADTSGPASSFRVESFATHVPVINDAGQVAFYAVTGFDGAGTIHSILVGDGVSLSTIVEEDAAFRGIGHDVYEPFLNASGQVAYVAYGSEGSVIAVSDGVETSILYESDFDALHSFSGVEINDAGRVAFSACPAGICEVGSIYVGDGGEPTFVVEHSCGGFAFTSYAAAAAINGAGHVAFTSCTEEEVEIRLWTPSGTHVVATTDGPFSSLGGEPALNDADGVAFLADLDFGGRGIFTGSTASSAVIETGDVLFGSAVTWVELGKRGLNDAGQVAFYYELADGRAGYARANPLPDCANGLDDDGDGRVDAADPGCADGSDPSERSTRACDDGLDNDGDGRIDLLDRHCSGPADDDERMPSPPGGGCGVGPELAALVPLLGALRRRLGARAAMRARARIEP